MTREEAIELLKEELQTSIDNKEDFADIDGIEKYNESLAMAIKALEQKPKTGHWTHDGSHWRYRFICSECGYKLFDEQTNYCPNCGVKMEREEYKE